MEKDQDVMYYSGDQNVFWDAAIKLAVLKKHGIRSDSILHTVHSADVFGVSRSGKIGLQQEYVLPDGNSSHWTPAMEIAEFLGRMPIVPDFEKCGINPKKIMDFNGRSLAKQAEDFGTSDWYGVSINGKAEEQNISATTSVADIRGFYKALKTQVRQDVQATSGQEMDINSVFPGLPGSTIEESYCEILSGWSDCRISSTLQMFSRENFSELKPIVELFYDKRNVAAYNKALGETGVGLFPLEDGQLPFFVLVKRDKEGKSSFERFNLESVEEVGNYCRYDNKHFSLDSLPEEIIAIVPKAIPLFLYIRSKGRVVLMRNGSSYHPAAVSFAKMIGLAQHPMVFIDLNALDNMSGIEEVVALPPYLHESFGSELVTMDEISCRWRAIVQAARAELEDLLASRGNARILLLLHKGLIENEVAERLSELRDLQNEVGKEVQSIYKSSQNLHSNKYRAHLLARAKKSALEKKTRARLAKEETRWREGYIETVAAERIIKLRLVIKSLSYWNDRPFLYWVKFFGGGRWYDQIIEKAQMSIEMP